MALTTFYAPRFRAPGTTGAPLPGAVLSFFEAGTATPLAVYADVDGNTSLGVTVTANAAGLFAEMFMLPQAYDINLHDTDGVLIWSAVDWFPPQAASSANLDVTATAAVAFSAGEGAYLSDGSNSLNPGEMYKWDADLFYASATPQAYVAVTNIAAGASGLFREAGAVTGLSGLTPGARYFMSGTAGALTTTPGPNARQVGQAQSTTVLLLTANPPTTPTASRLVTSIINGRLSLTTGEPVTIADVTAAATLYWVPYKGNMVALFTGSSWLILPITQLSIAVPAVATQMYDVFLDYNDGTPALTLTAWTNDTTRATALTTQDGVYVLTGDTQKRYLGSVRTVAAGQLNNSATLRTVWNYYNRIELLLARYEATDTWSYSTATWRQANGAVANQVEIVVGVAEVLLDLQLIAFSSNNNANIARAASIGEGSTTVPMTTSILYSPQPTTWPAAQRFQHHATVRKYPAVGYQYYAWLEYSDATATTTWLGDNTASSQSGLSGRILG